MSDTFWDWFLSQDNKGYQRTRHLNEVIHLHFKGFRKIENMELFTDLKCLYFEGNCCDSMEGLDHCILMRSLQFQDNFCKNFNGLSQMKQLKLLNLVNNDIVRIDDGILDLKDTLENLQLKSNKIGLNGLSDLENLTQMKLIATLDIQSNKIADPNVLSDIFQKMNLKVLQFQNNEAIKSIKNQRKTMISNLPTLTQIDERPVFEEERRFAEAFSKGGRDAEKEERKQWDEERKEKQMQYLRDFDNLISKSRAKHRKEEANKPQTEESEQPADTLKEAEANLTADQKNKIHDLAFSHANTTEDYMELKGDFLKEKESQWKKETQKPKPKPKDDDLIFTADDVEDETGQKPADDHNRSVNHLKNMDQDHLSQLYKDMRDQNIDTADLTQKLLSENVRSDFRYPKKDDDYSDMPSLEDVPEETITRAKNESDLNKVEVEIDHIRQNNHDQVESKSKIKVEEIKKEELNSQTKEVIKGKKKITIEEAESESNNKCSELKEKLLNELSSDVKSPGKYDGDDEFEFKSCTDDFKSCDGGDGTENGEVEFDEVECTNLDDLD